MENNTAKRYARFSGFWQIWFPFLLVSLLGLVLGVLVVVTAFNNDRIIHTGANIALSFLALLGFFCTLLLLFFTLIFISGTANISKKAPGFFSKTQQVFTRTANVLSIIARIIQAPFMITSKLKSFLKFHRH